MMSDYILFIIGFVVFSTILNILFRYFGWFGLYNSTKKEPLLGDLIDCSKEPFKSIIQKHRNEYLNRGAIEK